MVHYIKTEEDEVRRYKKELKQLEAKWVKDDWTVEEDYEWREFGFDDLIYDRLLKKHQRNLRRIRNTKPSHPTLWDFININH